MSKGRPIYSVRLSEAAIEELARCLDGHNEFTRDEHWDRSSMLRRALLAFVNHRRRGRKEEQLTWEEFQQLDE